MIYINKFFLKKSKKNYKYSSSFMDYSWSNGNTIMVLVRGGSRVSFNLERKMIQGNTM